jgi:hypothetical protein
MKAYVRRSLKLLSGVLLMSTFCYGAAESEILFNGTYRIELREGDQVSTASSQFLLNPGEKAKARMEPMDIEMRVSPVSDAEYSFHVIVTVAPNGTPLRPARIEKSFRGRFAVPLELGASEGKLKVTGSVSVLRYMPRAQ